VVEITSAGEDGCYGVLVIEGACQDSLGGQCYRQLLLSFGKPTPSLGVPVRVRLGPLDGDTGSRRMQQPGDYHLAGVSVVARAKAGLPGAGPSGAALPQPHRRRPVLRSVMNRRLLVTAL